MSTSNRKPDPERVAFLRALPQEIKETITGEEAEAFMFEPDIPQSLFEKIKDLIQEDDQPPSPKGEGF